MKRFLIPLVALLALVIFALTRAAPPPPIYPGTVPYQQLDTRNFELADYPVLRVMPFMARGAPPYLAVDTWSFAVDTNWWRLYGFNPLDNTWHAVNTNLPSLWAWNTYLQYSTITNLITYNLSIVQGGVTNTVGSMNPTDGYVPYRLNSTNFADSPWYRINPTAMGFSSTETFLILTNDNLIIGNRSGRDLTDPLATGSSSVIVGKYALDETKNSANDVVIGYAAAQHANGVGASVVIGSGAYPNGTGSRNVLIGYQSGISASASSDLVSIGNLSGGAGGQKQTFLGGVAGANNSSPGDVAIGYNSGANNAGTASTWIGYLAGPGAVTTTTNRMALGAFAVATNDNEVVIGNTTNTKAFLPPEVYAGGVLLGSGGGTVGGLWTNSPTGGGSLTSSSNVIASLPTGLYGSIFNNSEDIFAEGENAGQGQAVIQSTNLYNIGLLSGYGMTGNEAWMVMNIGDAAGRGATVYNSQDVYNFGIAPGELAQITNGSWVVMNIGDNAGYAMVTDKSQDIFNYGWLSGDSMGVSNSVAIFNYGDWAGRNNISVIQNSQEIYNYGYAAGVDQNPRNSTNLYNYGNIAGGVQQAIEVNGYYNYGTDSGWMGVGLASNSEELYNYGAWAGASLAALVADGTFVNFTNVYNYGPEAGMQIKGTNATYVLNYGYRAGEQSTMTGVSDLYNYGSDSGFQSTYDTSASDIYNYGTSAGKGASYTNAFFILNSGNSAGQSMVAQDSSSILNLGSYAGANMVATNSTDLVNIGSYAGNLSALTNSTHVYTWGYQAGRLLAGDGYTNIYLFGTAQPTRKTNEFVFGSTNDLYTLPGTLNGNLINAINVKVPPYSAKGDGVTDDTAALQAALNASVNKILYIPDGVYVIDPGTGLLPASNSKIVQAPGAIITSTVNLAGVNHRYWKFYGCSNVTMVGGRVIGDKTTPTIANFGIAYHLSQVTNVALYNLSVSNIWYDGILIADNCYNVTVRDVDIQYPGRNGISVTGVEKCLIDNAVIRHVTNSVDTMVAGVDIEPNSGAEIVKDVVLRNITVEDVQGTHGKYGMYFAAQPIGGCYVDNLYVRDCATALSSGSTTNVILGSVFATNLTGPTILGQFHKHSTGPIWCPASPTPYGIGVSDGWIGFMYNGSLNGATNAWVANSGTNNAEFLFKAGASTIMDVFPDGKVAIGNVATNPTEVLHVVGGNIQLDNNYAVKFKDNSGGSWPVLRMETGSENINIFGSANSDIKLQSSSALTVSSAGRTVIGASSGAGNSKVSLAGNIAIGANYYKSNSAPASGILLEGDLLTGGNFLGNRANKVYVSTTAADFFYIPVANTNFVGGQVIYEVGCTDGTDVQSVSGRITFDAVAKGTTVTANTSDVQNSAICTGGSTLTAAFAKNVATNNVFALGLTATTSLTTTNLVLKWRLESPSSFTVNPL